MISFTVKGDLKKTDKFLRKISKKEYLKVLEKYGRLGVDALSNATPKDSGKTAGSWSYEIESSGNESKIVFTNSNINKGVNIAIILQYGHGTGTGGYVQGRDYINPAMRPVFDKIVNEVWREVTSE